MQTMLNSYTFNTELTGFIAVEKDQGKYNNRTNAYQVPDDLTRLADDRNWKNHTYII